MSRSESLKQAHRVKVWGFQKGTMPWNKGQPHSPSTKAKLSENSRRMWGRESYRQKHRQATRAAMEKPEVRAKVLPTTFNKGNVPWNKGGHHHFRRESRAEVLKRLKRAVEMRWSRPEAHEKARKPKPQHSEFMKSLWQDPAYRSSMLRACWRKPNKLEKAVQTLLDAHFPGQWLYAGNGVMGTRVGERRPDFVHREKPLVIEVFGDFFHSPEFRFFRYALSEEATVAFYRRHGFDCLVIWEKEMAGRSDIVAKVGALITLGQALG